MRTESQKSEKINNTKLTLADLPKAEVMSRELAKMK